MAKREREVTSMRAKVREKKVVGRENGVGVTSSFEEPEAEVEFAGKQS
jgi:hypothetical protein